MRKKTEHEGWECVGELMLIADKMSGLHHTLYEIRNCERLQQLDDIVTDLKNAFKDSLDMLNNINTDIEWETVCEDED